MGRAYGKAAKKVGMGFPEAEHGRLEAGGRQGMRDKYRQGWSVGEIARYYGVSAARTRAVVEGGKKKRATRREATKVKRIKTADPSRHVHNGED